jgi:hypothetical protein
MFNGDRRRMSTHVQKECRAIKHVSTETSAPESLQIIRGWKVRLCSIHIEWYRSHSGACMFPYRPRQVPLQFVYAPVVVN